MDLYGVAVAPVLMFTGKGGVGKSTLSAACAVAAAAHQYRTLLIDFDGRASSATAIGTPQFPHEATSIRPNLSVLSLDPRVALDEYLKQHGQGRLARRLGATGLLDMVASAVPGMREILLLGRVKAIANRGDYDQLIIDGFAAGHTVRLMSSPTGFLDAVAVGPIRQQAHEVLEMITNPDRFEIALVTVAEITPLLELEELEAALRIQHQVDTAIAFVNRRHLSTPPCPRSVKSGAAFGGAASAEFRSFAAEQWALRTRRSAVESAAVESLQLDIPLVDLPEYSGDEATVIRQLAKAMNVSSRA